MIIDNLFRLVRVRKSSTVSRVFFLSIFTCIIFFTHGISYAALLQSTYLGGNGDETGHAMVIHPTTGDIYVTGTADSRVFVSRLSGDLKTLYQTIHLGGSGRSEGYGIAIHPATGDVYVTGNTTSTDFHGITNGADTTFEGYNEAFVARLSGDLMTLHQSTFLGGRSADTGAGIAVHPTTGRVYVTGTTQGRAIFPVSQEEPTRPSQIGHLQPRRSTPARKVMTPLPMTYLRGQTSSSSTAKREMIR
ncbi:MAG: hypothetical protein U0586_11900 [Candidatus Brocadiaceae bacterium]